MKNYSVKLFGVIALIMVIGFSMAACGKDDAATFIEYTGTDADLNVYKLIISAPGSRAAYSPKVNDDYELTINPGNKKSAGKVKGINGGYDLLPNDADDEFHVIVDGGVMIAIGGTITFIDDSHTEAFVSFLTDDSGTLIEGSTIAGGETVLYHPLITNLTAAKEVREFLYKGNIQENGDIIGELIAPFLEDTPTLTIEVSTAGKATIILPDPKSGELRNIRASGPFKYLIISDDTVDYFGTEADPIIFLDKPGRANENTYGLVCARDNTHLVGLAWVSGPTVMKGAVIDDHPDAPYYLMVLDCPLETGWNYVFFTFTGADNENVLLTSSKLLPSNYRWTVGDENYFQQQ